MGEAKENAICGRCWPTYAAVVEKTPSEIDELEGSSSSSASESEAQAPLTPLARSPLRGEWRSPSEASDGFGQPAEPVHHD